MSADQHRNLPEPLPTSRAVLEVMFKHCDECIRRVDTAIHRSQSKIDILSAWGDGKIKWPEVKKRTQQIDEVHQLDRDTFTYEVETLWRYCDPDQLAKADELLREGQLAVSEDRIVDEKSSHQIALSGVALIMGQRLYAHLLRGLRDRILEVLEAERADTGADIEALLAKIAPRNDDIATLYLKIIREKRSGKSENQIALDFTDDDKARADTLLRGVRRYRERLAGK